MFGRSAPARAEDTGGAYAAHLLNLLSPGGSEAFFELGGRPATVRALTRVTPETERAGRQLVRLTVDEFGGEPGVPGEPRRGYRRVALLERALEPARQRLTPRAFEQLLTALSMVSGFEAMIVQRDVRGLDAEQGSAASEWAARALVRAALHAPAGD